MGKNYRIKVDMRLISVYRLNSSKQICDHDAAVQFNMVTLLIYDKLVGIILWRVARMRIQKASNMRKERIQETLTSEIC